MSNLCVCVCLAELDFNDPNTLEIYSRIRSFKDDNMRDELAFARSLTASQRRIVHMCAKKEGLEHRSVGQGDERYVVVFKGAGGPDAGGKVRSDPSWAVFGVRFLPFLRRS